MVVLVGMVVKVRVVGTVGMRVIVFVRMRMSARIIVHVWMLDAVKHAPRGCPESLQGRAHLLIMHACGLHFFGAGPSGGNVRPWGQLSNEPESTSGFQRPFLSTNRQETDRIHLETSGMMNP